MISKNPMNDGCLYSAIFYQQGIKEIWDSATSAPKADKQKVCAYAPGESGYKWEEFKAQGIMAIDWEGCFGEEKGRAVVLFMDENVVYEIVGWEKGH